MGPCKRTMVLTLAAELTWTSKHLSKKFSASGRMARPSGGMSCVDALLKVRGLGQCTFARSIQVHAFAASSALRGRCFGAGMSQHSRLRRVSTSTVRGRSSCWRGVGKELRCGSLWIWHAPELPKTSVYLHGFPPEAL